MRANGVVKRLQVTEQLLKQVWDAARASGMLLPLRECFFGPYGCPVANLWKMYAHMLLFVMAGGDQ